MGRFADAWTALFGSRAKEPASPAAFGNQLVAGMSSTGRPPTRGTSELLAAYRSLPRLRSVVDRIASTCAAVPWGVYRETGSSNTRSAKLRGMSLIQRKREMEHMIACKDLVLVERHPVLDLLSKPNPTMTTAQVWQMLHMHLDLVGETFIVLERRPDGTPAEMWPIPPHWVRRMPTTREPTYEIKSGSYNPAPIPKDDVIWIRHPEPLNPYVRGTGLGGTLNNELDADEFAAQTTANRFWNNATPELFIAIKGAGEDEIDRFKEKLMKENRGHRKVAMPHVTNADGVTVQQLSTNFVDLDLVNLREFEASIIRETFGVPPEVLGHIENSNRATIAVAEMLFARYVMVPRLEHQQAVLNQQLMPQFRDGTILLYENPVPDDWDFELQAATAAPWSRSIDEWRDLQALEPLPDGRGEMFMVPFGISPTNLADGDQPSSDPAPQDGKTLRLPSPHPVSTKRNDPRVESVIDRVLPDSLEDATRGLWHDELIDWISSELRRHNQEVDVDLVQSLARQHLRDWSSTRIKDLVNESTRKALRKTLSDGLEAGETMRDLAKRVRDTYRDASINRSVVIARTETLRSSNWATHQGQKLAGVVRREWITITDQHARESHRAMSGQLRGIEQPFRSPGGGTAMYPGDFGDPSEDVNCRCTTASVLGEGDDEKRVDGAAYWKAFDRRLRGWEKAALRAFRRGFKEQELIVMASVEQAFGGKIVPIESSKRGAA